MAVSVYRASGVNIILVDQNGRAFTLGYAENFTLQKQVEAEALREIGNYFAPEIVIHGVGATFGWGKAWNKSIDLVKQGIFPSDAAIAAYEPFGARVIDQESNILICTLIKAVPQSYDIAITARATLRSNVQGLAITARFESELT